MTGKILSIFALLILVGGGTYVYMTDTASAPADTGSSQSSDGSQVGGVDSVSVSTTDDRDENENDDDGRDMTGTSGTGSNTANSSATPPTSSSNASQYTLAVVATHNSATSCWSAINGKVYDLTRWINQHPGGSRAITSICGKDGSSAFNAQHGGQSQPASMLSSFYLGVLK